MSWEFKRRRTLAIVLAQYERRSPTVYPPFLILQTNAMGGTSTATLWQAATTPHTNLLAAQ